jgi:hypothetical protein
MFMENFIDVYVLGPSSKSSKSTKLDTALMSWVQLKKKAIEGQDKKSSEEIENEERIVNVRMCDFVRLNDSCITDIVENKKFNKTVLEAVESYGIDTIISFYCIPGQRFGAEKFRNDMTALGTNLITAMQLWQLLEVIRSEMNKDKNCGKLSYS